jgi:signal transduction histidine kinase
MRSRADASARANTDGARASRAAVALAPSFGEDLSASLLSALQAVRAGDFTVRLPESLTGVAGKIADTFNEAIAANERMAAQFAQTNEELERRIEERTREREGALAQLLEAQKTETIGQLTGGVAHDFNNLLMAVMGNLELVRRRVSDDKSLRLLDNAVAGAQRGVALTQRLLAFARRQELVPAPVDVVALVSGIEDLLQRALGPSVRIVHSFPDTLPAVEIDAKQLELALLNLSVNARDAMPDGGSLSISAELVRAPRNETDPLKPGDYLCLSLADCGIGMDEITLAKATEPFFTTKGPGKGTGLGLTLVQAMATQSGGALQLQSSPGAGTTVHLLLPLAKGRSAVPRSDPKFAPPLPVSKALRLTA